MSEAKSVVRENALEGVRVIDFSWIVAGPQCTRILADFGADVIKIENYSNMDYIRASGGADSPNRSPLFNTLNRNKRSLTLNVMHPRGMELLKTLIKKSDVIVENFSSRVLEKWGLGYEEQKKLNPGIIYCSMSGFGHSGRDRDFVTWGPTAQALSGLTYMSGLPGEESAGWGFSYMDHTGGFYGTIAIMMALLHRNKTGEGQHLDLSQVEAGIGLTGTSVLDYTVNNRPFRRDGMPPGNRAPEREIAPHNSYPCRGEDRWCVIAVTNDAEWDSLVNILGNPAWANDERFATMASRFANQNDLDEFISQWTINLTPLEVFDVLQNAGVPAGAVQTPMERAEIDLQLKHRGFIAEVEHAELGNTKVESIPMKMSETPWKLNKASPLLGEHSAEIYMDLLGVSAEELGTLFEEGIA
ncbi:MAG: CoA transferase [Chloroflexota bacterium]|nr:CoA transferase [Chloroflexota bacterium]MEC9438894.1 CoA transferase [Chloroflexota bacterium]